jgi:hypothetical protein
LNPFFLGRGGASTAPPWIRRHHSLSWAQVELDPMAAKLWQPSDEDRHLASNVWTPKGEEIQQWTNILGWQFASIGFVWASPVACLCLHWAYAVCLFIWSTGYLLEGWEPNALSSLGKCSIAIQAKVALDAGAGRGKLATQKAMLGNNAVCRVCTSACRGTTSSNF